MIHVNDSKISPEYRAYLESSKWQEIRNRVLLRENYRCCVCGDKATHVHHIRGKHRFNEASHLEDVCAMCEPCHAKLHLYFEFCDNLRAYYEQKRHEEAKAKGYY